MTENEKGKQDISKADGKNIYDFKEIKDSISMKTVLAYYGIEVKKNTNIPCIAGTHADKKPSMKVGNKNCFCFSCMANFTVIDVVMQFENVDAKEASRILNDRYQLNLEPVHKVAYVDALPFSNVFVETLGLSNIPVVSFNHTYKDAKTGEEKTVYNHIHYGLAELYAEDKILYYEMLDGKLSEKINKIKDWENRLTKEYLSSTVFIQNCDITEIQKKDPKDYTEEDIKTLKKLSQSIFITTEYYNEQMKSISVDKSVANDMFKQLRQFYHKTIEPLIKEKENETQVEKMENEDERDER